jgi:hypothetical protein
VDLAVRWEVRPPGASPEAGAARAPFIVREEKKWGVVHEFAIPAGHVSPEGELRIEAWNEEPGASGVKLFLDPERAEVLAICGRFWPNVCRSFGLLLAQLGLVASVAAAAGALFSFPTANLVGFFVYGSGLAAGFLRETRAPAARGEAGASLAVRLEEAVRALGRAALEVLPDFAAHDPLDRLAAGRAVGVADLAAGAGWMLCVQGGILFLLAIWSLSRRELARAEEG